jgi:hypothetical protein
LPRPGALLQIFPTGVRATATGVALVLGLVGWLLATPVHDLYTTMPPLSLSLLSLAAVSPRHGMRRAALAAVWLGPRRIGAAESHHPHAQCSFMRRCALHANTSAQRGLAAGWSLRTCAIGHRTKGPPPLLKWLTVWSAGASRVTAWGVLPH